MPIPITQLVRDDGDFRVFWAPMDTPPSDDSRPEEAEPEFKEWTGPLFIVTPDILAAHVNRHCHNEKITFVKYEDNFFGCNTWWIQSRSFAAAALQEPDGTLYIKEEGGWPFKPEYAPYAIVVFDDVDAAEDEVRFSLCPKVRSTRKGFPDQHLGGDWKEFDDLFREGCENLFDSKLSKADTEAKLRELGFNEFINRSDLD